MPTVSRSIAPCHSGLITEVATKYLLIRWHGPLVPVGAGRFRPSPSPGSHADRCILTGSSPPMRPVGKWRRFSAGKSNRVPIFCQGCSRPGDPGPLSLSDCGQVRSLPLSAEGHLGSISLDLAGSSNQVAVGENRGIRNPVSRSARHRDTGPCTSLGQCAHQVPAVAAVSPPFWGASCEIPFVPVDSPNFNAGIAGAPVCRDLHDFSATVPDHLARRVQRKCLHSRGRLYMTHLQVRARLTNSFIELLEQLTFRWSMLYRDLAWSV